MIGDYKGKCFELCGVDHSRMLFNVKVVSQADYDAYLADLAEQGAESDDAAARRRQRSHRRPGSTTTTEGGHE